MEQRGFRVDVAVALFERKHVAEGKVELFAVDYITGFRL